MTGKKRHDRRKGNISRPLPPPKKAVEKREDLISKLPDDILVHILSMCSYEDAVRTAAVSRRWQHLHTQLPAVRLCMSMRGLYTSLGEPSEQRVQSMERTLRRRCHDGNHHTVDFLRIIYRKDVPFECKYVSKFVALANAPRLLLHVQCARGLPDEDAGEWSLELPPATTELKLRLHWYAIRPPRVHGPGVNSLRQLILNGLVVLRQEYFLDNVFPSLEELHIVKCTLPASIEITSGSMPRLKRLRVSNVAVMSDTTKAGIAVLADELTTLHVTCSCQTEPMSSDPSWFICPSSFRAVFTRYSSFRLRAPKLRVFDWHCCYADEVRVDSVGCLSDVAVQLAAGRLPRLWDQESTCLTMEDCDKQMKGILRELMPGLRPRKWDYIERKCVKRDERWLCFEISSTPKYD
uniref:F-box domain-containing protein n=1 Tax=Oryza punctata TaxID=4537 RepID=A0A0E0K2P2_ORYPU